MNKQHYIVFTKNGVPIDVYAKYFRIDTRCNKDAIKFCNDPDPDSIIVRSIAEFYLDAIAGYINVDKMDS